MYQYSSISSQLPHAFLFPPPFLTLPAGTQRHIPEYVYHIWGWANLKKKMPFQNTDFSTMEYFLTRDFSVSSNQFLKRLTELPLAF